VVSLPLLVRGGTGFSKNSALKGWRCRNYGSWDIFAGVIRVTKGGIKARPQLKVQDCSFMGVKESVSCS